MKAITTTYHGPTESATGRTRGPRYSATDDDGNRITIQPQEQYEQCHDAAALALCRKMGWSGDLIRGGLRNRYVYVFAADHRVINPQEPTQ